MRKIYLAIALAVIAITGVISFVARSDDEKEVGSANVKQNKATFASTCIYNPNNP